jgi:hypothetical protein
MAYLNLGDTERAASQLVQAEKMRLENPRLVTGRDLAQLSEGLMQLFGVPAGQLEIEERPSGTVVQDSIAVAPAPTPDVTVVPPAPPVSGPNVSFSASAGFSARAQVHIVPPAEDSEPLAVAPPVIVIPEEEAAVIEEPPNRSPPPRTLLPDRLQAGGRPADRNGAIHRGRPSEVARRPTPNQRHCGGEVALALQIVGWSS